MSQELKEKLLPKLQVRYARRNRDGKSLMLDELCEDHGYDRKYASKLLGDCLPVASGRRHPGPEPQYGLIEPIVEQMWLALRATVRQAPGAHSQAMAAVL